MTYNIEFAVSFNYGAHQLFFSKIIKLPFAPFYGLIINDHTEDGNVENDIELVTNNYCNTTINYELLYDAFFVSVRNVWKWPVSPDTIDSTIDAFLKTNWKRDDTTDLIQLKELMKRDHDNRK